VIISCLLTHAIRAPSATTGAATSISSSPPAGVLAYPPTRKVDVVDDYFGRKVADPYRWLEELDSPDTVAWVAAENKITFGYLEQLPVLRKYWIWDELIRLRNFR
jgi:prolyl oligopeptidase